VASAPPVAELGAPGAELLFSHRIIEIDSSALDPDGGDHVTGWAWHATTVDAPCDAEIVEGGGPVLKLWAGCAGTFDVELVVTDSAGVRSAPVVKRLALAAEPNPVKLTLPPLVERHHRCAGSPPRCVTVEEDGTGSIPLVVAWEQEEGRVEVVWSCAPPEGSHARLILSNAGVRNPRLTVETDGTRIAGDYVCTVTGTDARRTADRASLVVRVLNRPPEVALDVPNGSTIVVQPRYDATTGCYSGIEVTPIVLAVSDPDGDAIVPLDARPDLGWTGADGVLFMSEEPGGTFSLFDYEVCSVPGGPVPAWSSRVEYHAEDVNGGRGVAVVPLLFP
jgi:hypothetical protein